VRNDRSKSGQKVVKMAGQNGKMTKMTGQKRVKMAGQKVAKMTGPKMAKKWSKHFGQNDRSKISATRTGRYKVLAKMAHDCFVQNDWPKNDKKAVLCE
jgi:hypothetical protein